jgi:hypothetical protein
MKLIVTLTALTLTTPLLTIAGNKQDKENKEQLAQVSRIYVPGEGPNIEKVRDRIGRAKSCFVLADAAAASDATLFVTAPGTGANQTIAFQSSAGVETELKKDGVTIWTDSTGVSSSSDHNMGIGLAIVTMVNTLEHDAGCGKKKGALAQGNK